MVCIIYKQSAGESSQQTVIQIHNNIIMWQYLVLQDTFNGYSCFYTIKHLNALESHHTFIKYWKQVWTRTAGKEENNKTKWLQMWMHFEYSIDLNHIFKTKHTVC